MSEPLFDSFDPISSAGWKQKIQADLKGADYNKTLVWESPENIAVKPFYHRDEFKESHQNIPGQPKKWQVVQQYFIDQEEVVNRLMKDTLTRGAEAFWLQADKAFDWNKLSDGLAEKDLTYYLELNFNDPEFVGSFKASSSVTADKIHLLYDPIGRLVSSGNWFKNQEEDLRTLADLQQTAWTSNLTIDSRNYLEGGATAVQQLAYSIAHLAEYLHLTENNPGLKPCFVLGLGSNYFFEIAKIRALRWLYATVANEYGMNEHCHVLCRPGKRNKTLYDYNVNMLRTTTETMSGVLGGADAVCNLPYDALYHKSNEFGERISRNQLLIMKSESYLDQVSNPADGAYYIERITKQLATEALAIFKEIESAGGLLQQLKEGTIQRKIRESAKEEQLAFDQQQRTLIGTNKYPNEADRMMDELELYPFVKKEIRKTLIEPVVARRLAEKLEKDRLKNEEE